MILHRIEAASVGPFVGCPAVAGPFAPGLNILSAPNETGKTTLLKAAGRALFDRHTCQAAEIKALRPAGTLLAPVVTVEFATGEGDFRIEKTFLQGPRSLLQTRVGGAWQPIAEGDAADDRLQALLQSLKPGRGATDIAHWGMLGYLWMRQGEAADWPDWRGNPATGPKVQSLLAKVEIDPFIEAVRARLWAIYVENFTPTGQTKTGGVLRAAEEELAALEKELVELAESRRQIAADEEAHARLAGELRRLEEEHATRRADSESLQNAASQAELLASEASRCQHEFDVAQARLKAVETDANTLACHEQDLTENRRRLAEAEGDAARCRADAAAAQDALTGVERALEENAASLHALQDAVERARGLVRHRQLLAGVERTARAWDRAAAAQGRLDTLARDRAVVPSVPVPRLRKLETLADGARAKRGQIEALGLTVELTPDAPAAGVAVRADDGTAETLPDLGVGETRRVHAGQTLTLTLPGWGTVRMRSGAAETRAVSDALAREEGELRAELAGLGARSVEEARAFAERGRELDAQLKAARQELTALLDEEESFEGLSASLAASQRQLAALADGLQLTAEETAATLTALEGAEQSAAAQFKERQAERRMLERGLKEARDALAAAAERRERGDQSIQGLQYGAANLEAQAAALRGRYPGGLDAARDAAENVYLEARLMNKAAQAKLPPDAATVAARSRRARAAAEQVGGELARCREAQAGVAGRLELLGSQGLYPRETALLARRETLAADAARARTQGRAARLVHDLIERRRQAATKAVLAPLQARLGARFGEVSGERERQIFLDESLNVLGLGRKAEELVRFEDLSQGAREQLLLCLRLAVAEELAAGGGGPQSLILDDVLVNTDAGRQGRVLDVLSGAAAGGLQILVCTCHPERYRGAGAVVELRRPVVGLL